MFPVRRSTVVVHGGEELVIRKLVLAGILSAEKTYLDCLSVIKDVSWAGSDSKLCFLNLFVMISGIASCLSSLMLLVL